MCCKKKNTLIPEYNIQTSRNRQQGTYPNQLQSNPHQNTNQKNNPFQSSWRVIFDPNAAT